MEFTESRVVTFIRALHWTRLRIVLAFLLFSLFVLQVTCTASNVWLKQHDVHSQGIWKVCTQTKYGMKCSDYAVVPGYFTPIRVLMIISIFMNVFTWAYFVYMLRYKDNPAFIITILQATTGALIICGLGLFADKNIKAVSSSELSFGWSYIVGWCTVYIIGIVAILALFDGRKKKSPSSSRTSSFH